MTKQELLTTLATKCATWEEARETAVGEVFLGNVEWDKESPNITKQDWLAERERLINSPSWADAPEKATRKAMDESGQWCFFSLKPDAFEKVADGLGEWISDFDDECFEFATMAIAIPAGYDWRDSLEARPVWMG